MKQLPMTPELSALIKKAVGNDVETDNLAVFETIALNDKPLVGKKNSLFEGAVVKPITLSQMVDSINSGNHLPLIADHELIGAPKGRFFHAGLEFTGASVELRALFYLDPTETDLIAKLNAGSLDEVSVSFLSTQFLCSECGWDYFQFGTSENIWERTCANEHKIGVNGTHGEMVGLSQFIELSLVARGAADKPKIVGRSDSKLLPASAMRLAAKGFEIDGLVCRASAGEEVVNFDPSKLITDLAASQAQVITLTADKTAADGQVASLTATNTDLTGKVTTLEGQVTQLTADLEAAKASPSNQADYDAAIAYLGDVLTKVTVAAGGEAPATDALPKTVADLTAAINEKTSNLTAILPVGGRSQTERTTELAARIPAHAFTNRNLSK